ncbi:sulfur oxidation c-type cytochrome SoxX [Halarcobacter bivalviorum]|uniref:sulfur oxidation c-type cytochrome SoxX n=1 Tax=Halarcobacter bivalviorum TaxID=663364 RepID=UPI00100B498A|nr:sulfur oxidation c-type cytochrome SoxX [Halarcobacter bivalviorum]RXK07838.1 sulfur oxidation c-type cytochrome SoxX [Halarcobacter bivalviorum]
MKLIKKLFIASAICGLSFSSSFADAELVKKGEKIFNTKNLGNCLACHAVNGKNIDGPGSMGPKLTGLQYWPDELLYNTVYDIYSARDAKITSMPAFGKTGWLSDDQIKAVVAYLKTIQ